MLDEDTRHGVLVDLTGTQENVFGENFDFNVGLKHWHNFTLFNKGVLFSNRVSISGL